MEDKMKNMVILKNIPSNIVEEAIVILKPNLKIKSADLSENSKKQMTNPKEQTKNDKQYIVNEAELIVANYVSKLEEKRTSGKYNDVLKKYKKLKWISGILIIALIINILF